jgi:hypothetical protein
MDEKTRELIHLNCETYEFFHIQLNTIEEKYFNLLDELLERLGSFAKLLKEPEAYTGDDIIINKLKAVRKCGNEYLTVSAKFESEMQEMVRLAPDLRDSEIEFEGVENRFLFVSDYLDELEQSLMLQGKMRQCIAKQIELFKGFEDYE